MSWLPLKPTPISHAGISVKARQYMRSDGLATVHIYLSGLLHQRMGSLLRAHVAAGTGDTEGQVRIELAEAGAFEITMFGRNTRRLYIGNLPGLPERNTTAQPCRIIEQDGPTVIVAMPLEAWAANAPKPKRDDAKVAPPLPRPSAELAPHSNGHTNGRASVDAPITVEEAGLDGKKVHAVSYLLAKGLKVDVLAGGRLQINGEASSPAQVLARINALRHKAELPPVGLRDLV